MHFHFHFSVLFFCEKIFWVQRLIGVYLIFKFLCFSIIFRTGMILFDSSSWCSKQGFMFISGLALMFVLNGIMGNNYSTWILIIYFKYACITMFGLCFCFRGFPVWLKYVPGIEFRTDNGPFKVEYLVSIFVAINPLI